MSAVLPHLEITPRRPDWLAGAPGFEPGNGGIKIRKTPLICKGFPVSCCSIFADWAAIRSTLLPSGLTPIGRVIPRGMAALRSCRRFMPHSRSGPGRAMLRSETDDLAAQLRIFEATPVDTE